MDCQIYGSIVSTLIRLVSGGDHRKSKYLFGRKFRSVRFVSIFTLFDNLRNASLLTNTELSEVISSRPVAEMVFSL